MKQYVHKLYMHDVKMPITMSIETLHKACVSFEDVNSYIIRVLIACIVTCALWIVCWSTCIPISLYKVDCIP